MKVFQKICNNNLGRSMVEMLGVLAIIGVLSAGAMAGYSKAMFRHRVNQTIDVFNQVLQRTVELEQRVSEYDEYYDADGLIALGLLPNCQKTENNRCKLPIGELTFGLALGNDFFGQFEFYFTDSKSCIAFTSVGWENAVPIDWWYNASYNNTFSGWISIRTSNGHNIIYNPNRPGFEIKNKVEMSDIVNACKTCDENLGCNFYFVIRHEL